MKTLNFVAVILKVLLVNLLAALNFANVFLEIKNVWKIINVKKRKKNVFTSTVFGTQASFHQSHTVL